MNLSDKFEAAILGVVNKFRITVGGMTHALTFSIVNDTPFNLIIEKPAMKSMQASLDFDKEITTLRFAGKAVIVPLCKEKKRDGQSSSEEFTSEQEDKN